MILLHNINLGLALTALIQTKGFCCL